MIYWYLASIFLSKKDVMASIWYLKGLSTLNFVSLGRAEAIANMLRA